MGGQNAASLVPMTTSSGQVQFMQNMSGTSFNMGNQMDLVFNRKVVKPIRGGGVAMPRDTGAQRQGFNNQMTFDQFMNKQKEGIRAGRKSVGPGVMDYHTPHKSRTGAPLIKPEFQQEYNRQLSGLQSQKDVARRVRHHQASVNKSKQMVQQMKMQEARALAEVPIDDTMPDDDEDDEEEDESQE